MAKKIDIPNIGQVELIKRRRSKHVRLSIAASGQVRISLPYWAPYAAALGFAQSQSKWIKNQLDAQQIQILKDGAQIGKAHHLYFRPQSTNNSAIKTKITGTTIEVHSTLPFDDNLVQKQAYKACEKALYQQALKLLPLRLSQLAKQYNFNYRGLRIRKLSARWGSCSSNQVLTLNYYLIQLPWHLIDYVILHELMHTRHLNHSVSFWSALKEVVPHVKDLKKEIKAHNPRLQAIVIQPLAKN